MQDTDQFTEVVEAVRIAIRDIPLPVGTISRELAYTHRITAAAIAYLKANKEVEVHRDVVFKTDRLELERG